MGVKCLAQEHNAVPWPGLEPGTSDPESSALTIRPPRLPLTSKDVLSNSVFISVHSNPIMHAYVYGLPPFSLRPSNENSLEISSEILFPPEIYFH